MDDCRKTRALLFEGRDYKDVSQSVRLPLQRRGHQVGCIRVFRQRPKGPKISRRLPLWSGMVKNPSYYNPVRKPERTRDRRNVVLEQMYKGGYDFKAELDSLRALPLELNFHRVDHKEGPAPYFREELRRMLRAKHPVRSDYRGWEKRSLSTTQSHGRPTPLRMD